MTNINEIYLKKAVVSTNLNVAETIYVYKHIHIIHEGIRLEVRSDGDLDTSFHCL